MAGYDYEVEGGFLVQWEGRKQLLTIVNGKITKQGQRFTVDGTKIICQFFIAKGSGTCAKALVTEKGILEITPCGHIDGRIRMESGAWVETLQNPQEVWGILNTRFPLGTWPETREMVISYVQESLKF